MFSYTFSQGNSEYCWNTIARSAPGPRTGLAVGDDLAAGVVLQPADDAQERGLAAAGGTDQGDELVVVHVEADVLQRRPLALGGSPNTLPRSARR